MSTALGNCTLGLNRYNRIGTEGDSIIAAPDYAVSSHGVLYQMQVLAAADGKAFNLVGPNQTTGPATAGGRPFVPNTSSTSGWTIAQTKNAMAAELPGTAPHVMICMPGANNAQGDIAAAMVDYGAMLDQLVTSIPWCPHIVCSTLIGENDVGHEANIVTFNTALWSLLGTRMATMANLHRVDAHADFIASPTWATDNFTAPQKQHPNATGSLVLATTWYNFIKAWLAPYV